jgi:hypothetical protein
MSGPSRPLGLFGAAQALFIEYHSFIPSVLGLPTLKIPPQSGESYAALVGYPSPERARGTVRKPLKLKPLLASSALLIGEGMRSFLRKEDNETEIQTIVSSLIKSKVLFVLAHELGQNCSEIDNALTFSFLCAL